jgi:hypothetical protein
LDNFSVSDRIFFGVGDVDWEIEKLLIEEENARENS